ncbi:MAG: Xaa-Pro peptidase family protein, partial [Candidatus Competibacterales bacterium]|nr:Xaa-Pro peptidase family protein [Candidatus Competibacterales bacterium]
MLPFARAEYLNRVERTKARMEAQGVEVLLATDPANMNYLTGYDSWSFYVHQLVILALDADEPVWVGRKMDANAAKVTTYLKHDNIRAYSDDYVQSAHKHPMEFVAKLIHERGWADRRIGLEMDTYYFTAACYQTLQRDLPQARFADVTSLVNWVRVIKSPAELEFMSQAARIIEKAMRVAIDSIDPGVRHCDVAANIYHAQISGTAEFGGDYTAICPMLPTGVGTSTPHLTWTDEPFREGEATILELAG